MKVVALAGGVGGAKMAAGLALCLAPENLTVVVNIGDDFTHYGLAISPDLDTVCYTLAGLANPTTGWGRAEETWNAFDSLTKLGGQTWFRLGDRDLGTHLERSQRLRAGQTLSQVTEAFCRSWGIAPRVLPASDDPVPTIVHTLEGDLPFQSYFVHRQCTPSVTGFDFQGIDLARPAPGVLEAIKEAQLIVICPSNPWVSIDPILKIPGVEMAVSQKRVVAISPLVGGKAIKGPAAKMYRELGINPSALAVARHYQTLLDALVIDRVDKHLTAGVKKLGMGVHVTQTVMRTIEDRRSLAEEVLKLGKE